MKIGFVGLGKMGSQMAERLLKAGHEVVATDHNQANIDTLAIKGAESAKDRQELVQKLGSPAVIWLMIPAQFVDNEVDGLLQLLPGGSIIIDGGNSDFRHTRERAKRCEQSDVQLVDVGTSGGILGLNQGFSMMIGGDEQAFKTVEPILRALAQENGYQYFGPSGAGHYIKMIHNAVEYGVMEAYSEGYHLLKEGKDYANLDLSGIAKVWQHGSIIASRLNGLAEDILQKNPDLDNVEGYVAESGEARWALEVARQQGFELLAVQAAMDNRIASQRGHTNFGTKLLASMRNAFGGHAINKDK
ncbi:MAG TPA: decarboxylating 6-phosphogluconate dehydrogenase [Patescibacteria group bacterium]|jgi:6-phosphogluconate dehydrogenase|nr:decarboxylating 6-phosphogluconate dehydrogenase [Patescibacteria group bacterium]